LTALLFCEEPGGNTWGEMLVSESNILQSAKERHAQTLDNLKRLVELESPSSDKAAVDRLIDHLQSEIELRGGSVDRRKQSDFGDILIARFGTGDQKPLLVMTHVDTVWPVGTIERLPWRIEDNHAFGPGIFDMKASAAMMLTSLDVINDLGLQKRPITWIINTDEEVGSPMSRPILEALARESELVLCLEPPVPPDGALKTERKGVGMFRMTIEGRASHAGADHEAGISAVEELARQIQWLHGLTDYERGTTVNVGVISGGTKRNVVAAHAEALIDLRVTSMAEADKLVPMILNAQPAVAGTTITVVGELNRPPMERTDAIATNFQRVREIGCTLGLDLKEASTGGGSDGNFTAAIGVPTLDGLGCNGHGGHADDEHIEVDKIDERVALIAALLANF
jgi:glutamate carboxypeptidase